MTIKGTYPNSPQGNYKIIDTIGVPHPYCITPEHLQYADSMYLDEHSIAHAESKGAVCDICKKLHKKDSNFKILSYAQHEQALLVECNTDINPTPPELKEWLLSIKDEVSKNGYAGFAFVRAKS